MASSSSSSSSSVQQKFQVFLSFRGEDTRNNFLSHLHAALKQKGIDTYVDYRLIRGEEISQALLTAIEKSKMSIIVLSKNYASSSWCLDELSKILECKKRYGQEVVPIFYHVDPSDVRCQEGSFKEAFAKHQQRVKETDKVESWRAALKEVANLSGYHIQPDLPESTLVTEIVKDISKKLMCKSSYDTKHLVGIDSHIEHIESLLCIDSLDIRIIGISGMGGIGKTTIAEAAYNRFCVEFDGYCFVNVEEELIYGEVHLREKLFSKMLEDSNLNLETSSLPTFIKERLRCKKIFIVLDDVNDSMQLDLLSERDCFGPGSRIIVISRDKQVLRQVVNVMYEVKGIVDHEALQLFSMHAFKQSHPKIDFMELSMQVIHFAKGVPLALRVVGSALYGKSKCVWEGHLNKLGKNSDPKIDEVLKISYDGLEDDMKGIFLDIACFFRGKHLDFVENILDDCYTSVMYRISFLIDKSLITISYNMLNMHDLLQLMAWNIIRQESKEPGKRSRLWTPKDICHVLKNNTGTESIEGMFLDMSKIGKVCLSPIAFEKMWNLRLLNFYYSDCKREGKVYLSQQDLQYLPDNLIYLHWDDYPSKSLPSSFCPENLVQLRMPNSHVEQLWNQVQDLMKLKTLDLSDSQHLIKIPNLSRARNLESMKLDGCRSLVEVPSSIRYLNKLSYLSLSGCQNLRYFPSNIDLRSLTTLVLDNCSNLTKFPEISLNLERLSLNGTAIEEVPSSINHLSRLGNLNLTNCRRLKRLPSNICKLKISCLDLTGCLKFESFPEILETMECLKSLCLSHTSIEELPSSIEHLVGLKLLKLDYCEKLKNLPSSIMELKSLNNLSLINCSNFTVFPEIPMNLQCLNLSGTAIEQVPSSIERVSGLRDLYLETCTKLRSLPRNIFKLKNLRVFIVSGFSKVEAIQELWGTIQVLKIHPSRGKEWSKASQGTLYLDELPDNVENLNSLKRLYLGNCNLLAFPIRLTCISSLTYVNLSGNNFETIPASIKNLLELERLDLSYCKRLQSLPASIKNLLELERLDLSYCKRLQSLPASIKQLLKLERLDLSFCKRLQSLPELPPNLQYLNAHSCSSLEAVSSLFILGNSYSFSNCLKLDQNAISHILAETLLWIQHKADLKLYSQGPFHHYSPITICLPGSEIPEWFSCQNTGSSVTTLLPLYGDDPKFVGFVLCAVVALEGSDESLPVRVYCKHNFKTNNGCHHTASSSLCYSLISVGSDNMFLGYDWVDDDGFSEASFEFYIYDDWAKSGIKCWVKKCGVHALYRQNDQIISFPYNARVIQPSKSGSGSNSCGLPNAKDAEEFNSIMIGVKNQDFGKSTVEDGTIIKRCRSDYCYDEAEASGSFDTIMTHPSSPSGSTWLSVNSGVIDQCFAQPMQEDRTIIKRHRDDHRNNEAEPSRNFSSEPVEEEARCHRWTFFICFLGIRSLFSYLWWRIRQWWW